MGPQTDHLTKSLHLPEEFRMHPGPPGDLLFCFAIKWTIYTFLLWFNVIDLFCEILLWCFSKLCLCVYSFRCFAINGHFMYTAIWMISTRIMIHACMMILCTWTYCKMHGNRKCVHLLYLLKNESCHDANFTFTGGTVPSVKTKLA